VSDGTTISGCAGPVLTAWSAISPLGLHGRDFAEGLRAARPAVTELDPAQWPGPYRRACLVPGFDAVTALGRKGTRSMDRATALAVTAVDHLLNDGGARLSGVDHSLGLALGTSTGSVQSTVDFTRDSLVNARPYLVDPARFPNTVMNCAAGQAAIWHRLKGPNATVAGGRATGLLVLRYASRLLRAGHATALLGGAVEEFSTARAWLRWHAGGRDDPDAVLGEGAALWLLEHPDRARAHGRAGLAEVVGLEFGYASDDQEVEPVLVGGLRQLWERTGIGPADIGLVAGSGASGADGDGERAALDVVFGGRQPERLTVAHHIGDTYAASAAFQIAAVLASTTTAPRLALVTSVEGRGVVGAALLRVGR